MEYAGNGAFYLKNVGADAAGQNPYLSIVTTNNWTMTFVSQSDLSTDDYYYRAKFTMVELDNGKWGIKTMSPKNDLATHFYTFLGADFRNNVYEVKGDKLTSTSAYGEWAIDYFSSISITRDDGQVTITTTNTDATTTVYYTTDGTDPATSPTHQVYTAPFADNDYALVKAIVWKDGRPNSEMASLFNLNKSFVLQHQQNTAFYMLPGAANGDDFEVNTYSLIRPSMTWTFEDAGDGYFYIKNDSLGYYLSNNSSGTVRLKATNSATDDFKFWLRLAVDGTYRIEPKARIRNYVYKADNNVTGSLSNNNGKINRSIYWNILPSDHIPATALPFSLSDNSCARYVRINNANASTKYLIPPTESNEYASTSDANESNDRWYIRQVSSDEWLTYYAIINASTGNCLQYTGAVVGSGTPALTTTSVSEAEMSSTDDVQFAFAPTTNANYFYLIPKPTRYQNNRANYTLIGLDNSVLKIQTQRDNNARKWSISDASFTCDAPLFTYDAVQGTIAITSPNKTPIYYVGYDDGDPDVTPSTGTPYTGIFNAEHTHYKAIAARCNDGSDASAATYNLPEAFRCAIPKITFNTSSQQITITCATTSATIYYIIGNGNFDENATNYGGTLYSAAFQLAEPQVVKAIAVRGGDWSTASVVSVWDENPHYISKSSDITVMTLNYVANDDFVADVTIGTSSQPFVGSFDGAYHSFDLNRPLFGHVDGATVKNVRVGNAEVSGTGNRGAIVCEATGAARIYNCGVLGGTVSSTDEAAGGLVGHIASGSSVRVVNCYNYANVSGSTHAAGIVGRNEGTVGDVRIAMCMMYGKLTSGTVKSPVYAGNHTSNNQDYTEYNYWRYRAYSSDETPYTAYNDQLAIADDQWLERFPFYRHILNTHREMAAFFLFHPSKKADVETATAPTADEVAEIGHWVENTDVAPYPVIAPWRTNTKKTTVDIAAALPATTDKNRGKLLNNIGDDGYYDAEGNEVTAMGNGGYLAVAVTINGSSYNVNLPITDMNEAAYDYTWGKVVLPFANEFDGWQRDYMQVCTGWKITSAGSTTAFSMPAGEPYNFADRGNPAKDIYDETNNPYVFAQGGNYIVPYGVTAISIEANFAQAYYLSDARADFGYDNVYGSQTNLGWAMPTTYHGQKVYTSLSELMSKLTTQSNPNKQAIVLVGNFHYNNKVVGQVFNDNLGKAVTIMSADDDGNQEPDYGWYSYHYATNRQDAPPLRFDFVPNIDIGMAARVTSSTPCPTVGIWVVRGWFEITETSPVIMTQFETNDEKYSSADNGKGNNRCVINNGWFDEIVRSFRGNATKLSYVQVGGYAYIDKCYPVGPHFARTHQSSLIPVNVTGGEIRECFITGKGSGTPIATGSNLYFWCAGGKIGKYLSSYMVKFEDSNNPDVTVRVDHARIGRFFGGGTSSNAPVKGNIDVTVNNSVVDFYCGGPEFGDMVAGKTVTTRAVGTTFGEFYGAGFGGTSTTLTNTQNVSPDFGTSTTPYNLDFNNYTNNRLKYDADKGGYGTTYQLEYIPYSGGTGKGVQRFYMGYSNFSLATTGTITNTLSNCHVLRNFYGGGCQGKVNGDVTSTLTDCVVDGNIFGGGYKAANNILEVYPTTQPTYSTYYGEMGLFSDFGTVEPEEWEWESGTVNTYDAENHKLRTDQDLTTLGNVMGDISLTIGGNSVVGTLEEGSLKAGTGNVYGGGNESPSRGGSAVILQGNARVLGNVFGGGNNAVVEGSTSVRIDDE